MRTSTALVLTGATLALAKPYYAPRPGIVVERPAVTGTPSRHRRQDATDDAEEDVCMASYVEVMDSMPTIAPALLSWLDEEMPAGTLPDLPEIRSDITSECTSDQVPEPTPPPSLSSLYASYTNAADAWVSSRRSDIEAVRGSCDPVISVAMGLLLVTDDASCTSAMLDIVQVAESLRASATQTGDATETGGATQTGDATQTGGATRTSGEPATNTEETGAGEDKTETETDTGDEPEPTSGAASRDASVLAAAAAVVLGLAGVVAAL